jgi:hypothetical protein
MKNKKTKFILLFIFTILFIILFWITKVLIEKNTIISPLNNTNPNITLPLGNTILKSNKSDKPQPITLPKQTPLSAYTLDKDNVIAVHLPNGTLTHNIFEVAMQAIEGRKSQSFLSIDKDISQRKIGLLPRETMPQGFEDPYQEAAYKWLEKNSTTFGDDGLVWYYQFDNAYNDVEIKAPWGSAFGQAHVIKAFIHAFKMTGLQKYKELALKATKPFFSSIESGGFQTKLADNSIFFEEVPRLPATHILNGHMISTITLLEAGKELNESQLTELGNLGLEAVQKSLEKYDLGYWSKYDMNPKKGEIVFRLSPASKYQQSPILIDRVHLLDVYSETGTNLDVGSLDDTEGAWRVSGIEWLQTQVEQQKTVRGLLYGLDQHPKPVQGGTRQNSYVIMQLPQLKFTDLSKVPNYYLRVDYLDNALGQVNFEIQDVNHGDSMEFQTLTNGTLVSNGSKKWKSAFIPVESKYISWYMGPDYQSYHIQLLKQLYELTNKPVFSTYAKRWQLYLDNYLQESKNK